MLCRKRAERNRLNLLKKLGITNSFQTRDILTVHYIRIPWELVPSFRQQDLFTRRNLVGFRVTRYVLAQRQTEFVACPVASRIRAARYSSFSEELSNGASRLSGSTNEFLYQLIDNERLESEEPGSGGIEVIGGFFAGEASSRDASCVYLEFLRLAVAITSSEWPREYSLPGGRSGIETGHGERSFVSCRLTYFEV